MIYQELEKFLPKTALVKNKDDKDKNKTEKKRKTKEKLAIMSPALRPKFSILDPRYTFTVSKYQTAAGIVDIMSHIFEQCPNQISQTTFLF